MDIKLKIKCSCFCSYVVSENISKEEISCPNCGKIPSYSENLVKMLKIAKEIPDIEKVENGHDISIYVLSIEEQMNGA